MVQVQNASPMFFATLFSVTLLASVPTQRVLIVGDSEAGFVSRRIKDVKSPNEIVEVDAKGGTTIQYWANGRLKESLDKHQKPDVLVIMLGTNNYWNKTLPDVQPILNEVKSRNVKCIWVGPTEVQGKKWPINQQLKSAVQGTCTYIDTETLSIPLEDGVHPTWNGILKWLKAIWQAK